MINGILGSLQGAKFQTALAVINSYHMICISRLHKAGLFDGILNIGEIPILEDRSSTAKDVQG